jgi:hypothetical protein
VVALSRPLRTVTPVRFQDDELAKKLGSLRLLSVETDPQPGKDRDRSKVTFCTVAGRPDRNTHGIGIRRIFRKLERHFDVGLPSEVVYLVGLGVLNDAAQAGGVGQVTVMQEEPAAHLVRVGVNMIDAPGVEA